MDSIKLVMGADGESLRTSDDKAFCRAFGAGNAFEATEHARAKTAEVMLRWNSHEALVANVADSAWLLRELLSHCKDQEWRGRIEAQIGASDTVLALAGAA